MGIYLGQLPPAEIARLKAELAETLIANFCYPRFFDYHTESLQMRPVDRNKRQEVWLYLSSVDFTAWSRVDLMSPDLQHQIERLFIQFVQRNRSFFGEQGRRRMSDIRMLIGTCAATVTQGLRRHLTGQKSGGIPFGSPRPMVSWTSTPLSKRAEPTWEQIADSTMLLQRQIQEWRGEIKPATVSDAPLRTPVGAGVAGASNGEVKRPTRPQSAPPTPPRPAASVGDSGRLNVAAIQQPTMPTPPIGPRPAPAAAEMQSAAAAASGPVVPATPAVAARPVGVVAMNGVPQTPVRPPVSAGMTNVPVTPTRSSVQAEAATVPPTPMRQSGPLSPPAARQAEPIPATPVRPVASPTTTAQPLTGPRAEPAQPFADAIIANGSLPPTAVPVPPVSNGARATNGRGRTTPLPEASSALTITSPHAAARPTSTVPPGLTAGTLNMNATQREMLPLGEDDLAIFEQMRHQLLIWLRVEAVTAGLEINGQGPAQLLDMLRQQARMDETRLQVVSTLLNLTNQVTKTGLVSVLDYKQALMFHLMHTKRI